MYLDNIIRPGSGGWGNTGMKWEDMNGDRDLDAGEPGLMGWTIFVDSNGNSMWDIGEMSTMTDAAGNYTLAGFLPGTYRICEVFQANWAQMYPNPAGDACHMVLVTTSGMDSIGKNFGNYHNASISGYKWRDANGNGVWDAGELSLAGWTIFIDENGNKMLDPGEDSMVTTLSHQWYSNFK